MEANIVTERVIVREHPDGTSPVVTELVHGDRVTLGQATFKRAWIEVRLPDGRAGHMRGDTAVRAEPMAHAVVVAAPLRFRHERDMGADSVGEVSPGEIIACGGTSPAQYMLWGEIATPSGAFGYVEGEPHVQRIVWSQVNQKHVALLQKPGASGSRVATIERGGIIGIGPAFGSGTHPWLRAILPDGKDGFVPPTTHITRLDAQMRLRTLLLFPGKCASCGKAKSVRMANVHLGETESGAFVGDCMVPVCAACVGKRFYTGLAALFVAGVGSTVGTAVSGHELVGAIGFVPFGFYSMNAAHKGSTVRRFRRVAERAASSELARHDVEAIDLSARDETELDEIWPRLAKWIICPGCLQLHKHQSPWCPNCRYLFPWRFGPRP